MTESESDWLECRYLERARNGDADAFEWLYRRHVDRVYAVCLRMTADRELAEECTQRAFIRAWSGIARFRGDSRWSTWLHRVAVNEVVDCHREAGRRRLTEVTLDDGDDLSAPASEHGDGLDLEAAIARLPERARHVFVLIAIHGHSHEEAGALLGVTAGTCKAQYHRARRLLAGWLGLEQSGRNA